MNFLKITISLFLVYSISYANESYYKNGELVELTNLSSSRSLKGSGINYYKTVNGNKIGVKNEILIQCKKTVDCPIFLESYNLLNYSKLSDKIFIVKIESKNLFYMSRILFETDKVEFVHPNFIKKKRKR